MNRIQLIKNILVEEYKNKFELMLQSADECVFIASLSLGEKDVIKRGQTFKEIICSTSFYMGCLTENEILNYLNNSTYNNDLYIINVS